MKGIHVAALLITVGIVTPAPALENPKTHVDLTPTDWTVSGTVGGRGILLGADVQFPLTSDLRFGTGLSFFPFWAEQIYGVPGYVSWFPGGANGHSPYIDAGLVIIATHVDFCGEYCEPDGWHGDVLPLFGFGYAWVGEEIFFKAGLDLIYTRVFDKHDTGLTDLSKSVWEVELGDHDFNLLPTPLIQVGRRWK